uniref:Uncharacterized protein n=1 Tax=Octactis speculum TaxID=3111310 RepID=A0A7S2H2Y6_9STRA|mmetsp:Transcript_60861/g.83567  ORF Transcript_60861/g.83567 Transcript_60861/m.83567 type:complete len:265 (+) Transcript_60861:818-1612(+)
MDVEERLKYDAVLQPWDLNTDGIDASGRDYYVHHVDILNDDDSIAVKPTKGIGTAGPDDEANNCTQDMLFEHLELTGFGLSIGSVPPNKDGKCVSNITFRHISMPGTGKGIYVKSNPDCDGDDGEVKFGEISNLVFEDVTITRPLWWPIWVGPQQQHEPGMDLANKCSLIYPIRDWCPTQGCVDFRDIIIRDVIIDSPLLSPGVFMGNSSNPMTGFVFENVTVIDAPSWPFEGFFCENTEVTSIDSIPPLECDVSSSRKHKLTH